jgi:hypothetical protein
VERVTGIEPALSAWESDALLAIGPVLTLEDAVGNKLNALVSGAFARDFLGVDSITTFGKFTGAWS